MLTADSPRLSDLQKWMRWVLTHPAGIKTVLQKGRVRKPLGWTRGGEPTRWASVIDETAEVPKTVRLDVYGHAYFSRLIECLSANFESVKNVLGPEVFEPIAKDYLVHTPSTFKCIDDVGKNFPDFLRKKYKRSVPPYSLDLATMDWAFHESFYANDVPVLELTKLNHRRADEWGKAKLVFDPSVRLLDLQWPVDGLWREDGKWPRRKCARLKRRRTLLLMYRREDKLIRAPRINSVEFNLLKRLQADSTLGEALSRNKRISSGTIQQYFSEWVRLGIIREISFP